MSFLRKLKPLIVRRFGNQTLPFRIQIRTMKQLSPLNPVTPINPPKMDKLAKVTKFALSSAALTLGAAATFGYLEAKEFHKLDSDYASIGNSRAEIEKYIAELKEFTESHKIISAILLKQKLKDMINYALANKKHELLSCINQNFKISMKRIQIYFDEKADISELSFFIKTFEKLNIDSVYKKYTYKQIAIMSDTVCMKILVQKSKDKVDFAYNVLINSGIKNPIFITNWINAVYKELDHSEQNELSARLYQYYIVNCPTFSWFEQQLNIFPKQLFEVIQECFAEAKTGLNFTCITLYNNIDSILKCNVDALEDLIKQRKINIDGTSNKSGESLLYQVMGMILVADRIKGQVEEQTYNMFLTKLEELKVLLQKYGGQVRIDEFSRDKKRITDEEIVSLLLDKK